MMTMSKRMFAFGLAAAMVATGMPVSAAPATDPSIKSVKISYQGEGSETKDFGPDWGLEFSTKVELENTAVTNLKYNWTVDGESVSTDSYYRTKQSDVGKKVEVEVWVADKADINKTSESVTVTPRTITEVVANDTEYTGKEVTPEVTVKDEEGTVAPTYKEDGKDVDNYKVTYAPEAINVSETPYTATATATSAGYTGEASDTFMITPKAFPSITGATVNLKDVKDAIVVYNGEAQTPAVESIVLADKETTLVAGKDFEIDATAQGYTNGYKDNENVGTASIAIKGIGDYSGTAELSFEIAAKKLTADDVDITVADDAFVYDGNLKTTINASKLSVSLKGAKDELKSGTDYSVTVKNNGSDAVKDAGKIVVLTIKGEGNYDGTSIEKECAIAPAKLTGFKVTSATDSTELVASLAYTGKALVPSAKELFGNDTELVAGTDYEVVASGNNVNVNGLTDDEKPFPYVTIKGIKNYTGEYTLNFKITPSTSKEFGVNGLNGKEFTFTGEAVDVSSLEVYDLSDIHSVLDKSYYHVEYKASDAADDTYTKDVPVSAGTYTYKIVFDGNYKGTEAVQGGTFTIKKSETAETDINVALNSSVEYKKAGYTGTAADIKELGIKVTAGKFTLVAGEDYTVEFKNGEKVAASSDSKAPTVTVKIKSDSKNVNLSKVGDTDKTGINKTFTITKATLLDGKLGDKDSSCVTTANITYDGKEQKPEKEELEVYANGDKLTSTEFEISGYENNTNAGTATVVVTPSKDNANYTGTAKVEFSIKKATLDDDMVYVDPATAKYTGSAVKAPVVLKDLLADAKGKTVINSDLYTVTYKDITPNVTPKGMFVTPGNTIEVTVKIDSKTAANYEGSATGTYTIGNKDLEASDVKVEGTFTYDGERHAPKITILGKDNKALTEKTDYTVSIVDTQSAGNPVVKIEMTEAGEGKSYYTGKIETSFDTYKIIPADITKTETAIKLDKETAVFNGSVQSPKAVVESKLVADKDYKITFANEKGEAVEECKNVGTYTVAVEGIGNYAGSVKKAYTITQLDLTNDANIKGFAESYEYTGKAIEPKVNVAFHKTVAANMVEGTDYDVVYGENTKVGKGTITVVAKGNYTGSTTVEFNIVAKEEATTGDKPATTPTTEVKPSTTPTTPSTPAATVKLTKVTKVKVAQRAKKSVKLTWKPVKGAKGVTIVVKKVSNGKTVKTINVNSNSTKVKVIKGLKAKTNYKFIVAAKDANGKKGPKTTVKARTK